MTIIAIAAVLFIVAAGLFAAVASLVGRVPADEDDLCIWCGAVLSGGPVCRRCGHPIGEV